MFNRAFAEDDTPADENSPVGEAQDGSDASQEPEYTFAGFNVDFSVKIQLTPPTLKGSPPVQGQAQS